MMPLWLMVFFNCAGREEGLLCFEGATQGLNMLESTPIVLFDLGGRSTEFISRLGDAPPAVASLRLGCLTLGPQGVGSSSSRPAEPCDVKCIANGQRSELPSDPSDAVEALVIAARQALRGGAAKDHLLQELAGLAALKVESAASAEPSTVVLATGGSVTTVAAVCLGLLSYERDKVHLSSLTFDRVMHLALNITTEKGIAHLHQVYPWLTQERLSALPAGCCGVMAVMEYLGASSMLVSDSDLVEGLLSSVKRSM